VLGKKEFNLTINTTSTFEMSTTTNKEIPQMFYEYLPASELIEKLKMHPRDLVLRAMRKQVKLFYPIKSNKNLTYYNVTKIDSQIKVLWMFIRTFFLLSIGLDNRKYIVSQIIQIRGINNLNALATNSLNELLVFSYCFETESTILEHENFWNTFHSVNFNDVLVQVNDALSLKELILEEKAEVEENATATNEDSLVKSKTKKGKREEVFLAWLTGKNELEVSNMKKDDVWDQLRKIDPHLFVSEPKSFLRRQQIITFKYGRKVPLEA
jgi:hypothetical protein